MVRLKSNKASISQLNALFLIYIFTEEVVNLDIFPKQRRQRSVGQKPTMETMQFQAFNQHFNLTLFPTTELISPNFMVLVRENNITRKIRTDISDSSSHCIYRGYFSLSSDEDLVKDRNTAAFNVCKGMVSLFIFLFRCYFCKRDFCLRTERRAINLGQ